MNALRSWAVVYGTFIVLGLQGAALQETGSEKTLRIGEATSISTWVTAVVMGLHVIAVVVMMIRGTYLRRKARLRRRGPDASKGIQPQRDSFTASG